MEGTVGGADEGSWWRETKREQVPEQQERDCRGLVKLEFRLCDSAAISKSSIPLEMLHRLENVCPQVIDHRSFSELTS